MYPTSLSQFFAPVITISFFVTVLVIILFLVTRPQVKVFEQTNQKLILQIRMPAWRAASLFFAGFLIIPGLLIIFATSTLPVITTLNCHRYTLDSWNLNNISVTCDLKATNWLLQVTSNETISFNSHPYEIKDIRNYIKLQEIESSINYFSKKSSEKSLEVKFYDIKLGFVGFGFGILLCVLSIPIIIIVPFDTYTFDKKNNLVTLSNYKWFRTQVVKRPLNDVVNLEVVKADGEDGKVYLFKLILQSGDKLPLNACYTSFNDQEIQTVVNSIRTILKCS